MFNAPSIMDVLLKVFLSRCIFILVVMNVLTEEASPKTCGSHMDYLVSGPRGVPDTNLTASSMYPNSDLHGQHDPEHGRLYKSKTTVRTIGGWAAGQSDTHQYIQVAFNGPMVVCAVLTQGRHNKAQWVTSYTVTYSTDDTNWIYATNSENNQIFSGNTDWATVVRNQFYLCIEASYMRINPVTWNNYISMRIDFQGCSKSRSAYLSLKESAKISVWKQTTCTRDELTQIHQEWTSHLGLCAIKCHEAPLCTNYLFNPSDNVCSLLRKENSRNSEIIPGNSPFYYRNIDYLAKTYDYETSTAYGLYYKIITEKKTKSEASTICSSDDARLMIINSTESLALIQQETQKGLILTQETEYFVNGGNNGITWVFNTGNEIPSLLWKPLHPNTNNGNCVAVTEHGLESKDCNATLYFVCELWS